MILAQSVGAFEIAGFVIALLALLVSLGLLLWQVANYRLSGPRVSVTMLLAKGWRGGAGVITMPLDEDLSLLPPDADGLFMLAAEVTNRGRMAVDVQGVEARLSTARRCPAMASPTTLRYRTGCSRTARSPCTFTPTWPTPSSQPEVTTTLAGPRWRSPSAMAAGSPPSTGSRSTPNPIRWTAESHSAPGLHSTMKRPA